MNHFAGLEEHDEGFSRPGEFGKLSSLSSIFWHAHKQGHRGLEKLGTDVGKNGDEYVLPAERVQQGAEAQSKVGCVRKEYVAEVSRPTLGETNITEYSRYRLHMTSKKRGSRIAENSSGQKNIAELLGRSRGKAYL